MSSSGRPRRKFTPEFKAEAVAMVEAFRKMMVAKYSVTWRVCAFMTRTPVALFFCSSKSTSRTMESGSRVILPVAAAAVAIPVCGNGSVLCHADLERMRRETGARYAMVGRAALGDPWIFGGVDVSRAEAARFLLDYYEGLTALGVSASGAAGRVKQLLRYWTAGNLLGADAQSREQERGRALARADAQGLLDWLRGAWMRAS